MDKIEELLQTADKAGGNPRYKSDNLAGVVRHRAHRRQIKIAAGQITIAVLIFMSLCLGIITKNNAPKQLSAEQTASLNEQIQDLNKRIDSTLNLVQEVIASQKAQERLDKLNAELASIPDPVEEMKEKIEKTAFILVYYADKRYEEYGNVEDVSQTYNRVIELFPETRSAELARQRLLKIQNNSVNKNNLSI